MNATLPHQLPLRRVPERIVGRGRLEGRRGVPVRPRVVRMLLQGGPRPRGQRCVRGVPRLVRAVIEPQLPPGDQLVQERLRARAHPPPPAAAAARAGIHRHRRPLRPLQHSVHDLVGREVTEVEVRREPTGRIRLRVVAPLPVARQPLRHEPVEHPAARPGAAASLDRRHLVVDREGGERRPIPQAGHVGSGPALPDGGGHPPGRRQPLAREGADPRSPAQLLRQPLVQVPPEVMRAGEGAAGRAHRQHAVGVHRLQQHAQLRAGAPQHARMKERRIVVGHDHGCLPRQRGEEPLPRTGRRLDVRIVGEARSAGPARMLEHPIQDEPVQPVAGPGVAAPQRLEHDQRLPQRDAPVDGAVEGEVPGEPAGRHHPIHHRRLGRIDRPTVHGAHPFTILEHAHDLRR